jgi:hypothetical protein
VIIFILDNRDIFFFFFEKILDNRHAALRLVTKICFPVEIEPIEGHEDDGWMDVDIRVHFSMP